MFISSHLNQPALRFACLSVEPRQVKGLVCAVLSNDGKDGGDKWFRCRILEELEKGKLFRVRLLDYGSVEDVTADKVGE